MVRWRCSVNHLLIVGIATSLLITASFWLRCGEDKEVQSSSPLNTEALLSDEDDDDIPEDPIIPSLPVNQPPDSMSPQQQQQYRQIECRINDEYSVPCRREKNEVYLPFSFINRYFEVYGKLVGGEGSAHQHFDWQHSYSRVYPPHDNYTPEGVFMSFAHYNVEVRDRVKCISGAEGVPVSTQWGAQGYFYPIQIAQYGLSHYSKFLTEDQPVTLTVEDAEHGDVSRWSVNGAGTAKNVLDTDSNSRVIEFHASESLSTPEVSLKLSSDASSNFFLSFDIKFLNNGSVGVVLSVDGKAHQTFTIFYVRSDVMISFKGSEIYYGIGRNSKWVSITRDIQTDYIKGMTHKYSKNKKKVSRMMLQRIARVDFYGSGYVDNVVLRSTHHLAQFYYAADWLIRRQDHRGGWPITVTRKLADGQLELAPGWYSAMAQGQAISVLVRAYLRTKRREYLEAALRSTAIFNIPSSSGGVRAMFLDQYPWYEEYPTTPSCFVLNGFIYSLIGLYDLKTVASPSEAAESARLFDGGIASLKAILPLFDTGSGSVYDLRHLTLTGTAPNLARWDYHATHINQLLLLSRIDNDPLFRSISQRWIGYMKGKRAPHN